MKKTFPLQVPGLKAPRVVESIKSDVRKYLRRERRKALPEGVDFWDFDCRVGGDAPSAETVHVSGLNGAIDDVAAAENQPSVYVEIFAKPGHRTASLSDSSERSQEDA